MKKPNFMNTEWWSNYGSGILMTGCALVVFVAFLITNTFWDRNLEKAESEALVQQNERLAEQSREEQVQARERGDKALEVNAVIDLRDPDYGDHHQQSVCDKAPSACGAPSQERHDRPDQQQAHDDNKGTEEKRDDGARLIIAAEEPCS